MGWLDPHPTMLTILAITTPIFLLIGLGYGLGRSGLLTPEQFRGVGKLAAYVALPCLVVRSLTASTVGQVLNPRYVTAYAGGSLLVLALGLAIGLIVRRRSLSVAALRSLGMSSSNSAFIGFPVALQLLGPVAGVALALNVLIENLIVIPTALAAAEMGRGERASVPRTIGRTLVSLLKTPIITSVLVGMVMVLTGLTPPQPVARVIDMLAAIAAPLALLVIGGSLVGLQFKGLAITFGIIGVGKLVLHPLAVLGAMALMDVQGPLRSAGLVIAAAPMLSSLPVLAQRYGDEGPCAAALLATTMASFVTLSVWLWLLTHHYLG